MALSKEQLLLLNNLMYLPDIKAEDGHPVSYPIHKLPDDYQTVGDIVNNLQANYAHIDNKEEYGSYTSGTDWKNLINAISQDETLMNMQIVATHVDNGPTGGGGKSALFVDPANGEAVVTFRGTASGEWKDNFVGGTATNAADGVSTPHQQNALDWYESLDLSGYETVTVTGHSKGGNKAKYITLMDDSVDRCVSFDGQGFSDEFIEKYGDAITMRQHKIENHNVDGDYVNMLLNDVGETYYYDAFRGTDSFLENHCPNTFFKFDANGNPVMVPGERSPVIAAVDEFLNSLLRSASPALKKQLLTFAGELADCALAGDFSVDDLMVILRDEDSVEAAGYLIAYLLEYPTANAAHDIKQFFSDVGLGDLNWIISGVEKLLDSDIAAWIVEQIADGGAWAVDAIPDWLYKKITGFFGIDLKKEDIVFVLQLVGATFDAKQQIEVVPDSGKDISLPSLGGTPACFSVYADTLRAAAEKLGEASFDLARSADAVTVQRKKTSLFLGVIRIRLGSIARKLDKQSTKARKMQNTLASVAELYEKAEKAAAAHANTK